MHENEIMVFLLSVVLISFIVLQKEHLKRLPAFNTLLTAFTFSFFASIATLVEHIACPQVFNVIEHLCYAVNATLLFVWCLLVLKSNQFRGEDDSSRSGTK